DKQLIKHIEVPRHHALDLAGEPGMGEYECDVGWPIAEYRNRLGQKGRLQGIVAVEREDKRRPRLAETGVAGAWQIAAILMHHAYWRTKRGELALRELFRRPIVDDDDLEIAKFLGRQTCQESIEETPAVVARHDDTNGRMGHGR